LESAEKRDLMGGRVKGRGAGGSVVATGTTELRTPRSVGAGAATGAADAIERAPGCTGKEAGAVRIWMMSARAVGNAVGVGPCGGAACGGGAAWAVSRTQAGREALGDGNGGTPDTDSLVLALVIAVRTEISVMRGADGVIIAAVHEPEPPLLGKAAAHDPEPPALGNAGADGRGGGRTRGSGVSEDSDEREGAGGRTAGSGVNAERDGNGGRTAGSGVRLDFDDAAARMAGSAESDDAEGGAGGTMVPSASLRRTSLRRRPAGGEESWADMAFFPRYAHLRTCRW
jgi:hypothetical protein